MKKILLFLAGAALFVVAGCPEGESNLDGDCFTDAEELDLGTDPESEDSDNDGLTDCEEVNDFGTNPNKKDSDGDGTPDWAELDCISDPNDPNEVCYTCGWGHNDPGNLAGVGPGVGSTVANIDTWDQCGEEVPLWDLAGEYHILYLTAAW